MSKIQPKCLMWYSVLLVAGLAISGAFVLLRVASQHRNQYTEGKTVRFRSAISVSGTIHDFAIDEVKGRLFVVTDDGIIYYKHPSNQLVEYRIINQVHLVGLLPHAIVVKRSVGEVLLLDAETLSTVAHYSGRHWVGAVNYRSSTLGMLHDLLGFVILQFGDNHEELSRKILPFPNPSTVSAFAILDSGSLLYATNDKGLYHLAPPFESPERIPHNGEIIEAITPTQEVGMFVTVEAGAVRIWELARMKAAISLRAYALHGEKNSRLQLENEVKGIDALVTQRVIRPFIRVRYCPSRRLLVVNDPMPKKGTVMFFSTETSHILDEIAAGTSLYVSMYLSADGKTLITGSGDLLRIWDIPAFALELAEPVVPRRAPR